MGLLDGMLGNTVASMLSGGNAAPSQSPNALDSILGGLGGGTGGSTGLLAAAMGLLHPQPAHLTAERDEDAARVPYYLFFDLQRP